MAAAPAAAPAAILGDLPAAGSGPVAGEALTQPPVPIPSDQVMVVRATKQDWLGHGLQIPLDDIEFDLEVSKGQIRGLSPELIAKMRREMLAAEPVAPLHALLVASDPAGVLLAWVLFCNCNLHVFN